MENIEEYLNKGNWTLKENANFNYSYSGLLAYVANNELKKYALKQLGKIGEFHRNGDLHIHNLTSGHLIPYCHGGSLLSLLLKGIRTPSIASKPAKHFTSVLDHIVNYFFMSQLEFSGAQAFSDFDTLLAPFVHYDNLSYDEVRQNLQRLVYNLNFNSRQAFQTPFTNLTFNVLCPSNLKDERVVVGGKIKNDTYADFDDESIIINMAFCDVLKERDATGAPFTFPIPTLNVREDFPWDSEAVDAVFDVSGELGSYYFMNYVGSGIDENSVKAMCCRLNLDLKQLSSARGFWNIGDGTGSIGVVTLNLSRLGYVSRGINELLDRLDMLLDAVRNGLEWKRSMIKQSIEMGLMPFQAFYNLNLNHYFSTVGVIGLNEMCINFSGNPLSEEVLLVRNVLEHINQWCLQTQEETGYLWNVEMVPGEGSCYRLAKIDRKMYPDMFTQGTEEKPYYTTLLIPPNQEISLFERIRIDEQILPIFTGGTASRIYLGEKANSQSAKKLMKRIVSKTKIPYLDYTSTFSICKKEGKYIEGVIDFCPTCNSEVNVFSRVVGYYRSLNRYNPGKTQEFSERRYVTNLEIIEANVKQRTYRSELVTQPMITMD